VEQFNLFLITGAILKH